MADTTKDILIRLRNQVDNFSALVKQKQEMQSITREQKSMVMGNLGVMFAGMALQRTMSSLNSTAREWVGMNEIMSDTMGVVTLPATLDLMNEGVIPLSEALLSLPEEVQRSIGALTIGLEGLGAVVMTGGQLALGLASFKIVFPRAFATLGIVSAEVLTLTGVITGFGVALAGVSFGSFVQGLAEMSKAYNKLGDDIATTQEILGQKGQGSRETTAPSLDLATLDQSQFPEFSFPGAEPAQEKGLFDKITDFFVGSSNNVGSSSNVQQTNIFNGFTQSDLQNEIDRSNTSLVNDLRRVV